MLQNYQLVKSELRIEIAIKLSEKMNFVCIFLSEMEEKKLIYLKAF